MPSSSTKLNSTVNEISFHPKTRVDTFTKLALEEKTAVLLLLSNHVKRDIFVKLADEELVALLERLDPDDATDALQLLNEHRRTKILELLSEDLKDTVTKLLKFDPDTAAGLMKLDYIQVDVGDNAKTVAEKFRQHEKRTGRLPEILVLAGDKLEGILPVHQLGFIKPDEKIQKLVKHIPTIDKTASKSEVVDLFRTHPHNKVAVLDDTGLVLGIIYSDDVLMVLEEQKAASLYGFAGVRADENVADPASRKIKFRYKWLIINLGTAFLASFTVGLFEETITKYVLLAVYMPIVAGMGGNAATQTLAVVVRGIALRQIDFRNAFITLKNELGAGFVNGLINGFLVAFVVIAKDRDPKIAFILACAMVINLLVAATFGTIVPLVMTLLRKDPATSATIFITTATDVLGFLAFLGLATVILN